MNILLVSARRSAYTGETISAPHQGVLALAAALREGIFADTKGMSVEVLDDQLFVIERPWAPPSACLVGRNPDIIGVQTTTSSLKSAVKLLESARERNPRALRLLGGVGVSNQEIDFLKKGVCDVIIRGEGEIPFCNLAYQYDRQGRAGLDEVPGIVYLDQDGEVRRNAPAPLIRDLDILPLPARDLVDMEHYRRISRGRAANLLTSRGCDYACSYCYSRHHWGHGQRKFSVARAMEEVRVLVEHYGVDRIRMEDDDFLNDKAWAYEFCDAMVEAGYHKRVEWEAKARPDEIDKESVRRLREANCFRLLMGVETLNPELLKRVSRSVKVDVMENALGMLRTGDIGVQATLILGIPGETDRDMRHTLSYLEDRLKHPRDIVSPCFFIPFNHDVRQSMIRKHKFTIEVHDTDCYTGHIPLVSSPSCSIEELNTLYEDMTPNRRGKYKRIAHLASRKDVEGRLTVETDGSAHAESTVGAH